MLSHRFPYIFVDDFQVTAQSTRPIGRRTIPPRSYATMLMWLGHPASKSTSRSARRIFSSLTVSRISCIRRFTNARSGTSIGTSTARTTWVLRSRGASVTGLPSCTVSSIRHLPTRRSRTFESCLLMSEPSLLYCHENVPVPVAGTSIWEMSVKTRIEMKIGGIDL